MLWTSALYVFSNRQLKSKFNVDLISFIVTKNHSSSDNSEKRIYHKRTPLRGGREQKPDIVRRIPIISIFILKKELIFFSFFLM